MKRAQDNPSFRTVRLALLGFGNAGQAFARLLYDKKNQIARDYGRLVEVVAVVTKSRGCLTDPLGLDLPGILRCLETTGRLGDSSPDDCPGALDVALRGDYDVLVELTPLAISSGQPAIDHIKAALTRGKHVVTANKGPIAWAFHELERLAQKHGGFFLYETTVMDGTPIFNLVRETLRLCRVTSIDGILNTTTNFILEELARGRTCAEALAEGRARGFVEADPAMDIEGYDAAAKLAALLNVLMNANLTPKQIARTGISGISENDVKAAGERGNVVKLLCRGYLEEGKVRAVVEPVELPQTDLLATIDGTSSAISITTDLMGKLTIVEHNPEIEQTAYGILSDLLQILSRLPKPAST